MILVVIGVGVGGNRQGEGRSGARLAPQPDGSVVIGRDVFDDGQSEARATRGPGPRLVDAEESFEHPLLVGPCNADATVGHGDLDVVTTPAPADRHRGTVW